MSEIRLIVGLGNPGKEYRYTRHNFGFLVLEELAKQQKAVFKNCSFTKAMEADFREDGFKTVLLLPLTYMNLSGEAVAAAIKYYKVPLEHMLIVCDDLHIDFGQMRIRPEGSDGGNNGLKSIIERTGSKQFARLRLGIGAPAKNADQVRYVLETFTNQEKKHLDQVIQEAVACCLVWLKGGTHKAMNQFNRRKGNE